jgi:CRISPR-associated protein Cmr6
MSEIYTGDLLVQLLEQQYNQRNQSHLFKKGSFTIQWRAKVGSFPHPDTETIVSAGEPCGAWRLKDGSRPEDKRNIGEDRKNNLLGNIDLLPILPLNGYIPGSTIRGIVRAWAKKRAEIKPRMLELLGYQDDDQITPGKIDFLDAWPIKPTRLTLDIVNPQQSFQVFHKDKPTPLSFYTLGNGEEKIDFTVAIRANSTKVTAEEITEVWEWVEQALNLYGVGSRTASGYGVVKSGISVVKPDPDCSKKTFDFTLFSQGCYGVESGDNPVLRPSHWRGWLRSWILRFLLGVMSEDNALKTLGELMGILEPNTAKGCIRLQIIKGQIWGEESNSQPVFYTWQGKLSITAPKEPNDILNKIILPIIRFAIMVGGVGRGWRRPLHIFEMNNGRDAVRGSYLDLKHKVKLKNGESKTKLFGLAVKSSDWQDLYNNWADAVKTFWPNRYNPDNNPKAEVFSPKTCAVYLVPGPGENPLNIDDGDWEFTEPVVNTRGDGMGLIYRPEYKKKKDVGGIAAGGGGDSECSWVSIRRVNIPNHDQDVNCQEIVCLFMGGQNPGDEHLRSHFLQDLQKISGAVHLFGVQ